MKFRPNRFLTIALSTLAAVTSVNAADLTWIETNSNNTWDTTQANWGPGPSAWTNGNSAIIGGTAEQINLGAAINAAAVTLNTSGYTLALALNTLTTGSLNYAGAANGTLTVTGGAGTTNAQNIMTLGGPGTGWSAGTSVNFNGSGNPAVGSTQHGPLLKVVFGAADALGSAEIKVKHAMIQAGSAGMTLTNNFSNAGASMYFGGEHDFTVSGVIKNDSAGARTLGLWVGTNGSRTITLGAINTNGQNVNFEARGTASNPNPGGGFIVNGAITGGGGISTVGATQFVGNTVTMNGVNTFTGKVDHFSGTLINKGSITSTSGVQVENNAVFTNTGTLSSSGIAAYEATSLAIRGNGLTGGTLNNSGTASFTNASLNGNINLTGGSFTVTGQFNIGENAGNYGVINQSAGITNLNTSASGGIRLGHWTTPTGNAYNLSGGTLNALNSTFNVGWDGGALFAVSSGVANLKGLANGAAGHGGSASTTRMTGGRINLGSSGIVQNGGGAKVFELGAGTIGAFANWSGSVAMKLTDSITGTTFDTLDSVDEATGRTITISGLISGNGKLVKEGAGSLVLTNAANSYNGGTDVNEGTLVVNGNISTSSLTTIGALGTLTGGGTLGAVSVLSGGQINPGNIAGRINTGNLDMAGIFNAEINGLAGGTGYDQINVTGSVSLSGLLQLTASITPVNGDLFFLLINDGSDTISGTFSGLAEGATVTDSLFNQYQITYVANAETATFVGGNDVALMAIPEPSGFLLGGLGALALLRRRRS